MRPPEMRAFKLLDFFRHTKYGRFIKKNTGQAIQQHIVQWRQNGLLDLRNVQVYLDPKLSNNAHGKHLIRTVIDNLGAGMDEFNYLMQTLQWLFPIFIDPGFVVSTLRQKQ